LIEQTIADKREVKHYPTKKYKDSYTKALLHTIAFV
jgi:hypothetical protein